MAKKTGTATGYLVKDAKSRAPEFSISEKYLPAIKEWKVGKKYSIELNVEMVSQSKGSDYEVEGGKDIHTARFKILSVDSEAGAKKSENIK